MIRHYCDVCGNETNGRNLLILELKEDNMLLGRELIPDGCMNSELCCNCAKKIALYVLTTCKEDN